jgi:thioesterase domain-containing protein
MCAGGVIAHEMTSQLVRAGERVELVVLLDAANPRARKRPGRVTKQRMKRMAQVLDDLRNSKHTPGRRALAFSGAISRKFVSALKWELMHRVTRWSVSTRFQLLHQILKRRRSWPRYVRELSVREIYDTAEARYIPKTLSNTPVILVRARAGDGGDTPYREIYAGETFEWDAVTTDLAVVDVEGGHSSMLQEPLVECLATALMPYVSSGPGPVVGRSLEIATSGHRNVADIKDFVRQP